MNFKEFGFWEWFLFIWAILVYSVTIALFCKAYLDFGFVGGTFVLVGTIFLYIILK